MLAVPAEGDCFGWISILIMSLMLANSKGSAVLSGRAPEAKAGGPLDTGMLLRQSLQKTSMCFSLDHCFQPDAAIELSAAGEDCSLKETLLEVGFDKQAEHLENYYEEGEREFAELTEYYKYYAQSSITYQPAFYKIMHNYREQRKAIEYNRLKAMLDFSHSSSHSHSHLGPRLENSKASFRLLSFLKVTRNEESVLLERLKEELQHDYGPNRFTSIDELDRQYCFSKMVDLTASFAQMQKPRRPSKKNPPKLFVEKASPLFKTRIAHNRKNSCGQFYQTTTRKEDSHSKARPKKHASMDLGSKEVKLPPRELKDTELKRKILGMKEQIQKEKELLMRRPESTRSKKVAPGLVRRMRH